MADTTVMEQRTPADGLRVNRKHLPFETDGGVAPRAAIGLIVLATDQTIEHEWRDIMAIDGVALYESRVMNSASVTPETLKAMEARLPEAADVILPGLPLDAIAYGCTSASIVITPEVVEKRIHEARPGVPVTNPMTAALAAYEALGVKRIALLTPYIQEINDMMRGFLVSRGLEVPVMGSFNEEDDITVARITAQSVRDAALELGREKDVDGVFVSCTSLRVAAIAEEAERTLGKPVLSSNHAMAWHVLRLAGVTDPIPGYGSLYRDH